MLETTNSDFQCELKASPIQQLTEGIWVEFAITSHSTINLRLLPWHTPLEGIFSRIFTVLNEQGHPLDYDGPLMKRPAPKAEDYLIFKANETLKQKVDLSQVYRFKAGNQYRISIDNLTLNLLDEDAKPLLAYCSTSQLIIKVN